MTTIRIAAVGDILMWGTQIASARQSGGKTYSFDSMFQEVAPYLRSADLTIGNLETTLSGREAVYQRTNPQTGFPKFNCPDELAGTLKRCGFNVLTTANNHCMDRGIHGLERTLRVLDKHGLLHTGTYLTKDQSRRLLTVNVKGIRVGVLSYTYSTNRIPVPSQKAYAVNYIHVGKMQNDLRRLKKQSDMTIVVVHFGNEFHRYPNDRQKSIVRTLFRNGADVVLGVHPHVLQPMAYVKIKETSGQTRNKFVIYSLGNFVSDTMRNSIHTESGVIVTLTVEKTAGGKTIIKSVGSIPTWVHKYKVAGRRKFRVLPVRRFQQKPDAKLTKDDIAKLKRVHSLSTTHLRLRRSLL